MSLRSYLLIMIVATLVCWGAFCFVIFSINPDTTNWVGFLLFYISLFLAVSGTAAILGFVVRFIALKRELAAQAVREAFRQSFLFSVLSVAILLMLAHNLFSWLNLFLLVVGLSVLEYFLITYTNSREQVTNNIEDNISKL
ncbi:MAG: hypothetical protein PHT51_05425 [Patescibacteria group bacterium]|nr:hypothetical protein [Patescibacteria group bacterium]MDD4610898.1 hypothetical protein [Patescibacteria group bacterium]